MGKKGKRALNYNVALPSPKLSEYIKPKKLSTAYRNMTIPEKALFFHTKQQWGTSYLTMNLIDVEVLSVLDKADKTERIKFIDFLNKIQDEMKCQWAILVNQLKKAIARKERHTKDSYRTFIKRKAAFMAGDKSKLVDQTKLSADNCAFRDVATYECKMHAQNCTRTDG